MNLSRVVALVLSLLVVSDAVAEEGWARAYDVGDRINNFAVARLRSGEHVAAYSVARSDWKGGWIRFRGDGVVTSSATFDTQFFNAGAIAAADDGGFLLAGSFKSPLPNVVAMVALVRFDAGGSVKWSRSLAVEKARLEIKTIASLGGDNFILGGTSGQAAFLMRIRGSDIVWAKTYQHSGTNRFDRVVPARDGLYVSGALEQPWIGKISSAGDIVWSRNLGNVRGLTETKDGSLVVCGRSARSTSMWFARLSSSGDMVWQRALSGGAMPDMLYDVAETASGNYVFAGFTQSFGPGRISAIVLMATPNGEVVWQRTQGGADEDLNNFSYAAMIVPNQSGVTLFTAVRGIRLVHFNDAAKAGPACALVADLHVPVVAGKELAQRPDEIEIAPLDLVTGDVVLKQQSAAPNAAVFCDAVSAQRIAEAMRAKEIAATTAVKTAQQLQAARSAELEYEAAVAAAFRSKEFDKLEVLSLEARDPKQRFRPLMWKNTVFYRALAVKARSELGIDAYIALLEEWQKARPSSAAARIALAVGLNDQAWKARGSGYTDTITSEGAARYEAIGKRALKLLSDSAEIASKDPRYWVAMMFVTESAAPLAKGRVIAPSPSLYLVAADFTLPQWGGTPGDYLRLTELAAADTKAYAGDSIYAQLAESAIANESGLNQREPRDSMKLYGFSWPRMRDGFRRLIADDPGNVRLLHSLARFAWINGDRATARELMTRPELNFDQTTASAWRNKGEYDQSRLWALEPIATLQLLPAKAGVESRKAPLAWIDKPAGQWPRIVLANDIALADRHVTGFSSFLIQTDDGVRAMTSLILLDPVVAFPGRERPKYSPTAPRPPTVLEVLKTKMQSWTMSVPGAKEALHVATIDGWKNDSGRMAVSAVLENVKSLPVAVLQPRSTPLKLGDHVYVIGCSGVARQCRQSVYTAKVSSGDSAVVGGPWRSIGLTIEEGAPKLFGAAVIDDAGFAACIVSTGTLSGSQTTCVPIERVLSFR